MIGKNWLIVTALFIALGAAQASEAESVVRASGQPGGICLVVGAKDTALAEGLARKGFYAQVLQPEAKTAVAWGAKLVGTDYRENIGVRAAGFDAAHYGTNLFNLIVVEDAGALGKAKLADLCRILVPKGVVAFRKAPGALTAPAGKLKMTSISASGFAAALRKAVEVENWKPCDSVRWRAGPRAQYCSGFVNFKLENGTLSYLECMEVPGSIKATTPMRFVRDAYNGRVIKQEAVKPANLGKRHFWAATGELKRMLASGMKKRYTGKGIPMPKWGNGCFPAIVLGDYLLYHHNIWVNLKTKERSFPYLAHPACFYGHVPGNNMIYNFPSRKGGCLNGITAIGAADIKLDKEPGAKTVHQFGRASSATPTAAGDWTMFRANAARGNSTTADPGAELKTAWEVQVGRGGRSYGLLSSLRCGLTQPVSAWGLVIVADIDGERIVALDARDGKQKWAYHVGSRVDMSPALYKGMCIFAAHDGWVYGLDAKTGKLCYRLLVAPRERYIGGMEKLENLWPCRSDVLIHNGMGYASAGYGFSVLGGARAVGFRPETGEIVWKQCYYGPLSRSERQKVADIFTFGGTKRKFLSIGKQQVDPAKGTTGRSWLRTLGVLDNGKYSLDDVLAWGNSLPRNAEDRSHFLVSDGKVKGRVIAFSDALGVGFTIGKDRAHVGRRAYAGEINLAAAMAAKKESWRTQSLEFVADDIVLTPKLVYCVGHYERIKQEPELWVMSVADGKVMKKYPVKGFPAFHGMSAAGKRLFIATRDGKLVCLKGE